MAKSPEGRTKYDSLELCQEILIAAKDFKINLLKLCRDLNIPINHYRFLYSVKSGNKLPPLTFTPEIEESIRKFCEELDIRMEMYEIKYEEEFESNYEEF